MLSSFIVQLTLYVAVMMAGNLRMTVDDIRMTGIHSRTMLAAYQVLVVCTILASHSVFLYFIRVVKRDDISFVLVNLPVETDGSDPSTLQNTKQRAHAGEQWTDEQLRAKQLHEQLSHEREKSFRREQIASKSLSDAEWQDPELDWHEAASNMSCKASGNMQFAAETLTETMSGASYDDPPLNIVFENSTNLDLYVLYVNFIGLVLWDTFLSFNFATHDSNFVLVSGLVCGWIMNTLSKECRCQIFTALSRPRQKLAFLFYMAMFLIVMALGAVRWRAPEDLDTALRINLYLPAFCSGVFWTGISADVAFTGFINQGATKGILYDARRSIPTFVLVMCVSALYSSPETRADVLAYTSSLSRLALLHLLLIEPVLIFLSIYVMVIALEKQRSTDFTLVMVLVQGARIAYNSETYDGVVMVAIACSVLLLSFHVSRLMRS